MSDTEKLYKLYTKEVRIGQLNQDLTFSVSLCSNSALLKDLQSDMKGFNSEKKFKFFLKDSKNTLFQMDEELLKLCFTSLLKWISLSLFMDTVVEVYSANSDECLHFGIKIPETLAVELSDWMMSKKIASDNSSDKFNYFIIFRNSFKILEDCFKLTKSFNKLDNQLIFTLPVKVRQS